MKNIWSAVCNCTDPKVKEDHFAIRTPYVEAENEREAKKAILRNLKAEGLKPKYETVPCKIVVENKTIPVNDMKMSFEELYDVWEKDWFKYTGYFESAILDRIISDETIEKFVEIISSNKHVNKQDKYYNTESDESFKEKFRKQIKSLRR